MLWFDPLVGQPFIDWLRSVVEARYTPQVPGDPFATSMRDLDDVTQALASLKSGASVAAQRVTDLRAAKLVSTGETRLSPLGEEVLESWQKFNVADGTYTNELPRQLLLVCCALSSGEPHYLGIADFWKDKCERYGADALLDNLRALYLLTYFSRRIDGFSPIDQLDGFSPVFPTWDAVALRTKLSTMVGAGDPALDGFDRIAGAIESSAARGRARRIFLIAMLLAQATSREAAEAGLATWKIPLTSTATDTVAIPDDIKVLCLSILDEYRGQLFAGDSPCPPHLGILIERKNVIMFGPPGTGKTYAAQTIAEFWRSRHGDESVVSLTFHPSYSYEDFVWGWRPDRETKGTTFVPQLGALLEACAVAEGGTPTLLLIDEINRADTARVFGELITFIEADKRNVPFRLAQDPKNPRSIPENLYVLGTMNTADRSVSLLDVALRRRFAFIEFVPDDSVFGKIAGWSTKVGGVEIASVMNEINRRLQKVGVEPDRAIGHALFRVRDDAASPVAVLRSKFQFDIHPLVVDYCFSDRSRVSEVLGPLVSSDGRLLNLGEADFLAGLRSLLGLPVILQDTSALGADDVVASNEDAVGSPSQADGTNQ
ncbi:McrB family protein [Burkholderia sp. BCC1985]|uniref:McrB family protein n=1 Tax=Burkholderia sp. BCC1985 TaxID=2817442 RepID=UPI002AB157DE|nr:AAA family ATPase [Burkholderia sp. BCC1985]